ncbi:cobalamin-dependent protein (plasmid) [Polymorphobacter sp. PAMC 29334]|uniref:cobalamin B12-binding domain-containing protein n=1 Tax=Polymorphobacter sp. PAMC 29334 TaxID=2862331 RepID=UPI001C78D20E|nr:cobalamin-dependent protein [Polymorphobacter sp. PAMC 29334]QYE33271.1 cobalamin-dependent protein [Polymorphobacter sp. PAMC 29334]
MTMPEVDRGSLHALESHFIASEIYRREDLAQRQARIARLVSGDIVPRLLQLHKNIIPEALPDTQLIEVLAPNSADIGGLADVVLGSDLEAAVAYITVLSDRGLALETLFVELLEPTARRLGTMWDHDECDFIDVTLGVARLQKLLAIFNGTHTLPDLATKRRVLMAMTPGDQHSFGVMMVERFLSAAGWQVQTEIAASADEIVETAASDWFAVIGLTAGSTERLATLRDLIPELRAKSRNGRVGIMVGGPMFTAKPELAQDVGADATACSAPTAVLIAQKLFDLRVAA